MPQRPLDIRNTTLCQHEVLSGYLLLSSAACALFLVNFTPLESRYHDLIHLEISIFHHESFSLMRLVNDFLMSFFFLLLGLELKSHLYDGEFKDRKNLMLPAVAAFGGFVAPALCYLACNWHSPETLKGWAIPLATDTAFMLAVLSLFSQSISIKLRAFIIGFSLIDDLLAILVLTLFYRQSTHILALLLCASFIALLWLCRHYHIKSMLPYLLIGLPLWAVMIDAGFHGTLAGIVIAVFLPITDNNQPNRDFIDLQKILRPIVFFAILPLFAFINSGVTLALFSIELLYDPLSLGIISGLVIGKPLGIMLSIAAACALRLVILPHDLCLKKLCAVASLSGIGFTFSLFIGDLSFSLPELNAKMRLSIILASLISAILGSLILIFLQKKH